MRVRRPSKGPMVAALLVVACGIVWSFYRRTEHLDSRDRTKFACTVDEDCTNSCSQGAVSKAWLASHSVKECADGCNDQLTAPSRCIQQECVAYAFDPDGGQAHRDEHCTKVR